MAPSAAEVNPLANLKQEMSLNHSMAMDQLNRLAREMNKLKPSMEELQSSVMRTSDRLKEEMADEMLGMSGRVQEMERTLKEDLENLGNRLQERLMGTLQEQISTQQETLDQLTNQLEILSRNTMASLSQLRMALTMAEVEAQVRQRHPAGLEKAPPGRVRPGKPGQEQAGEGPRVPRQPGKDPEEIATPMREDQENKAAG